MKKKIKSLVVGFGSIGQRHATLLKGLSERVDVVSQRPVEGIAAFPDISAALASESYNYIVICNKTSDHYSSMQDLAHNEYKGILLVEKPVFEKTRPAVKSEFCAYIAYNLRFHPILREIHHLAGKTQLYSMHVYCGQYLPTWRERDYTQCYSSSKENGGGVLRDLSHELDYITWIAGPWTRVAAIGGKMSSLKIDSDDLFCILMETARCNAITLQINYLDLEPRREIILNGEGISIKADLISGTLLINGIMKQFRVGRDETYLAQHIAAIEKKDESLCSFKEGIEGLRLIETIETASREKIWIQNR